MTCVGILLETPTAFGDVEYGLASTSYLECKFIQQQPYGIKGALYIDSNLSLLQLVNSLKAYILYGVIDDN